MLEHRDKNGKLLTPKEAFRQLSYQFHGKTPGKKNKSRKALNYAKSMAARGVHCFCLLNNGRRSNGYFAVVAGYIICPSPQHSFTLEHGFQSGYQQYQ